LNFCFLRWHSLVYFIFFSDSRVPPNVVGPGVAYLLTLSLNGSELVYIFRHALLVLVIASAMIEAGDVPIADGLTKQLIVS